MVEKIIFCNDEKKLAKLLANVPSAEIGVVQIACTGDSERIMAYLRGRGFAVQHIRGSDHIKDFEKEYAEFIGRINVQNHDRAFWWALNLTNKNPITTGLCEKIYFVCLLRRLVKTLQSKYLLVMDSDDLVYKQLGISLKEKDVKISCLVHTDTLKKFVQNIIPASILSRFVITVLHKAASMLMLREGPDKTTPTVCVMSLLYEPAFKDDRYRDLYFGKFVEHLKMNGTRFISFMWVFGSYTGMIKKSKAMGCGYNIFTKEYFISFTEIGRCLFSALKKFYTPPSIDTHQAMQGIDVSYLLKAYFLREFKTARFFSNLIMHNCTAGLCRSCTISKFYYPFENRAFEKMMILAVRETSSATRIVGYQHASLSLRHMNFMLCRDEAAITPMPDTLVSMGEATKDIMELFGNFPPALLTTGCALRQQRFGGAPKAKGNRITKIFVVLATNIDEYVKVLKYLDGSEINSHGCMIWIRPHPGFPLEEAISIYGKPKFPFHKADRETLEECFAWADAVLYVHSTISLEAMARGIPVINLGVDNIINPDPLFNFDSFKWRADRPEELIPTIERIQAMGQPEFEKRQREGIVFAERYIGEATAQCMERFLAA